MELLRLLDSIPLPTGPGPPISIFLTLLVNILGVLVVQLLLLSLSCLHILASFRDRLYRRFLACLPACLPVVPFLPVLNLLSLPISKFAVCWISSRLVGIFQTSCWCVSCKASSCSASFRFVFFVLCKVISIVFLVYLLLDCVVGTGMDFGKSPHGSVS